MIADTSNLTLGGDEKADTSNYVKIMNILDNPINAEALENLDLNENSKEEILNKLKSMAKSQDAVNSLNVMLNSIFIRKSD